MGFLWRPGTVPGQNSKAEPTKGTTKDAETRLTNTEPRKKERMGEDDRYWGVGNEK